MEYAHESILKRKEAMTRRERVRIRQVKNEIKLMVFGFIIAFIVFGFVIVRYITKPCIAYQAVEDTVICIQRGK